jgi:TetR/AcrR family transcriptional repressor of nem operon
MKTRSVREELVEHALVLIRRRGFNGFSYRDLAELVGVKTSSIHYYFPSKDDLVLEAVREYRARKQARLDAIDSSLPPAEQARQYLAPLCAGAGTDQACLVGMLAADVLMLPESVRGGMRDFVRVQVGEQVNPSHNTSDRPESVYVLEVTGGTSKKIF